MPARVVPPTALAQPTSAPLDLSSQLRRVAAAAAGGALDEDTLEALACEACDAAEGGGAGGPAERRASVGAAVAPILEDAGLPGELTCAVLEALLDALGTEADDAGPPLQLRQAPVLGKQAAAHGAGRGTWMRRSEAETARAAEYLRERAQQVAREQREEVEHEQELAAFYGRRVSTTDAVEVDDTADVVLFEPMSTAATADGDSSEEEEDEVTVRDREATKRRLRELGEPATLFGETDVRRTARLRQCELCRDQDVLAAGSTNVMQILDRRAERDKIAERDEEDDYAPSALEAGAGAVARAGTAAPPERGGAHQGSLAIGDGGSMFAAPDAGDEQDETLDADAKVVVRWLRATLREWEATLLARTPAEGSTAAFKSEKAHFRQSKQYLRPLRKSLRERDIQPAIIAALAQIAAHCDRRQYKEAKEDYMRLAIGNSPWPMGVTNVTFHDRANRHKISEDTIAHVLDDETTRKYVQMVKRLLSFCELRWPVDPSLAA